MKLNPYVGVNGVCASLNNAVPITKIFEASAENLIILCLINRMRHELPL
jgi:hypothetical protein